MTDPNYTRTVEFAEQALEFVRQINEMTTRIIASNGQVLRIQEDDTSPQVEAAAILMSATMYATAHGDMKALQEELWPATAQRNLASFELQLRMAKQAVQ